MSAHPVPIRVAISEIWKCTLTNGTRCLQLFDGKLCLFGSPLVPKVSKMQVAACGKMRRSGLGEVVVRPTGFEPMAPRLGIWCSILLSYGRPRAS